MAVKKVAKSSPIKRTVRKTKGTVKKDPILDEMKRIYGKLPAEKKIICFGMLEEAAFLKNTLNKLRAEIDQEGYTDEYKNGENQYGRKVSATLQSYNSTLKNYYVLMEKLMRMFPLEEEEANDLIELMNA